MIKLSETQYFIGAAAILLVILIFNSYQLTTFNGQGAAKSTAASVQAKPAELDLVIIQANNCALCTETGQYLEAITSTGATIKSKKEVSADSDEGKKLISKHGIQHAPALIISGDVEKSGLVTELEGMIRISGDSYVVDLPAPYLNLADGKTEGLVIITYLIKPDCSICQDVKQLALQLKQAGVAITQEREVTMLSAEGSKLMETYSIDKVPTIILSNHAKAYTDLTGLWKQVGTIEADGSYVMRNVLPPFYDIKSKAVKGKVSVTILSDSNCTACYNPEEFHMPIMKGLGLYIEATNKISVSTAQGKSLLEKYKITAIPTIILTGDIKEYQSFGQVWQNVGSVEADGAYVFRNFEVVTEPYQDLAANKIVYPEADGSAA